MATRVVEEDFDEIGDWDPECVPDNLLCHMKYESTQSETQASTSGNGNTTPKKEEIANPLLQFMSPYMSPDKEDSKEMIDFHTAEKIIEEQDVNSPVIHPISTEATAVVHHNSNSDHQDECTSTFSENESQMAALPEQSAMKEKNCCADPNDNLECTPECQIPAVPEQTTDIDMQPDKESGTEKKPDDNLECTPESQMPAPEKDCCADPDDNLECTPECPVPEQTTDIEMQSDKESGTEKKPDDNLEGTPECQMPAPEQSSHTPDIKKPDPPSYDNSATECPANQQTSSPEYPIFGMEAIKLSQHLTMFKDRHSFILSGSFGNFSIRLNHEQFSMIAKAAQEMAECRTNRAEFVVLEAFKDLLCVSTNKRGYASFIDLSANQIIELTVPELYALSKTANIILHHHMEQ